MVAQMALFQEMVDKLSPPRIDVNLTQEEEDRRVGGLIEQLAPIFLVPESVNPSSKNREETESPIAVWEVLSGIEGLIEEWDQVEHSMERSITGGP